MHHGTHGRTRRLRPTQLLLGAAALTLLVGVGCSNQPKTAEAPPVPYTGGDPTIPTTTSPRSTTTFAQGGPNNTLLPQTDAQLDALGGAKTWEGYEGTLVLDDKGTAQASLKVCPLKPGAEQFGYNLDCAPTVVSGVHSASDFWFGIQPDGGDQVRWGVYVDATGHLHLGQGHAYPVEGDRNVNLLPDDANVGYIIKGDQCWRAEVATQSTTLDSCPWATIEGFPTVTAGGETYIYDPDAQVVASPSIYFGIFRKR